MSGSYNACFSVVCVSHDYWWDVGGNYVMYNM